MHRAPIALVTVLLCGASAGIAQAQALSLAIASVAVNAQGWPPPRSSLARIPDSPEREFGVTWSSWISDATDFGTVGISYARYLSKELALEAAVDVGRHEKVVSLSSVQLRAVPKDFEAPVSLVIGLAYATPGLPGWPQPRGLGMLVGGGMHFRFATSFAFRMDLQLLRFREEAAAGRACLTLLVGLD